MIVILGRVTRYLMAHGNVFLVVLQSLKQMPARPPQAGTVHFTNHWHMVMFCAAGCSHQSFVVLSALYMPFVLADALSEPCSPRSFVYAFLLEH